MKKLKSLEKQRRKAAGRSLVAMRAMCQAFSEMGAYKRAIEEMERKENKDDVSEIIERLKRDVRRAGQWARVQARVK